jgi:hypothetical protein
MIKLDRIMLETPLKTRAVTMVTVSEVMESYHFEGGSLKGFCLKRPLAVAVATRKGVSAFNTDGEEMKIPEFFGRFPDAKPLLEKKPRKRRKQQ